MTQITTPATILEIIDSNETYEVLSVRDTTTAQQVVNPMDLIGQPQSYPKPVEFVVVTIGDPNSPWITDKYRIRKDGHSEEHQVNLVKLHKDFQLLKLSWKAKKMSRILWEL